MRVKVTYAYLQQETIDVEMPDGIEPSEILRRAKIEAHADAPSGARLERVSWLTATKPQRFGGTI